MPFITVVIPTYNRKESLLVTLRALERQTLGRDLFEVVVVSDGSTDGTREALNSATFPYRLRLMEQQNSGPSAARNLGARAACGKVIVYLDDDIESDPDFLNVHAQGHAIDDRLVLIGPQSMPKKEWFPVWVAWEHRMLEKQYARFRSGEWEAGPNNLYSGNFSVRREFLIEVGGFDERFLRQEDVELGYRLEAAGLHFKFDPLANGLHRPTRSFASWCATPHAYGIRDVQMARDKGQDRVLALARKHWGERNLMTRLAAKAFIGKPILEPAILGTLKKAVPALDKIGLRSVSLALCSVLFNLLYFQGMAQEIGGAGKMWRAIGGNPAQAQGA